MASDAKGENVYQRTLAVQQALVVKSGVVGHAGGELSGMSQSDNTATVMSGNPPAEIRDNDDGDVALPTLPPPTPSQLKRRFSALSESVGSSFQSTIPDSSSAGISRTSRSASSSSSKRGRMIGALALSSLGRELSHMKRLENERNRLERERLQHKRLERERLEHKRLEHKRLEHERLERKRLEHKRLERERLEREQLERERLERERLEHERLEKHLEQQVGNRQTMDPMLDAIYHLQQVDSDLPTDDQAILVDLFNKNHDSAKVYLALESDPLRKAWIKRKLTQAGSG